MSENPSLWLKQAEADLDAANKLFMGKKKTVDVVVKDFAGKLARIIDLDKVILFGSQATDKTRRWSDIDLLIISKSFESVRQLSRGIDFYDIWTYDYPVDFLCYTPKEFEKSSKQIGLIKTAIKEGKLIYPGS